MKKFISLVLVVIIAVGIYYVWWTFLAGGNVKLYFAVEDGAGLRAESRKVMGDLKEGALEELIKGPANSKLSTTIPNEVRVLNIKVTDELCVVNFNEKLVTNHWGGSTGEILTVYSIVNTLCQFRDIERVQILVEGKKIETLAGHLILNESLEFNERVLK
ncbi:MAG: GerMN domain-containing protein [Halanaerobiales bacterium]|nr:GerMN domain-containing protein [Halanaerobiales bacterium]